MDISNKTLAVLLILGMAVSLFGALNVTRVLDQQITGFAITDNSTGTVNYTVSSNVLINFSIANIDFGAGYVNKPGYENCTLVSNTSDNGVDCIDFNNVSDGLMLLNIGNKNANITLSFDKNATGFMNAQSLFSFQTNEAVEATSCIGGLNSTFTVADFYEIEHTTNYSICQNFSFAPGTNDIEIDVKLVLDNAVSGADSTTTVTAAAAELV